MSALVEYLAYISCDSGFFNQLEGIYTIMKYHLEPCEIWERNQHRMVSNFALSFILEGLPEKGLEDTERIRNSFLNQQKAVEEAKLFIAWLSTAIRKPLDLSHIRFGGAQGFGPSGCYPIEDIDRDLIKRTFHLKENTEEGKYEHVKRPNYGSTLDNSHSLGIPDDFPSLTKKLYSLHEDHQEKYFDSCLSYQFVLINYGTIPSISLVALVNAVESLMRDKYSSGYCEDTGKLCPQKRDVMKKFRAFFEENLQYPLPDEKRRFLNEVYRNRSNIVHKALMGSGPFRGPIYMGLYRERELANQISDFRTLVNVGMINWLMRI